MLSGGAPGHLQGPHLHRGTMLKMVWHWHHHRHSRHVNEVGQKEEQARFAFQVQREPYHLGQHVATSAWCWFKLIIFLAGSLGSPWLSLPPPHTQAELLRA